MKRKNEPHKIRKELKSVSVIGQSAIGMPATQLLIRHFPSIERVLLIDPDTWEKGQLQKHAFSQQSHLGRAKVEVSYELIRTYNPKIKVEPLQLKVQDEQTEQAMLTTDFYLVCVDNDDARLDTQIIATQAGKPLLDISAEIIGEEKVGTVRFYSPGKSPCLLCQGLDISRIMSDSLREARIKAGYLKGTNKNPHSIAVLDTTIAAMGIALLADYIQDNKNLPTTLSYNQSTHEITKLKFQKKKNCKICNVLEKETSKKCRK
jgi:molybdopterin/thiamine biosynthesis adenylyltransferase